MLVTALLSANASTQTIDLRFHPLPGKKYHFKITRDEHSESIFVPKGATETYQEDESVAYDVVASFRGNGSHRWKMHGKVYNSLPPSHDLPDPKHEVRRISSATIAAPYNDEGRLLGEFQETPLEDWVSALSEIDDYAWMGIDFRRGAIRQDSTWIATMTGEQLVRYGDQIQPVKGQTLTINYKVDHIDRSKKDSRVAISFNLNATVKLRDYVAGGDFDLKVQKNGAFILDAADGMVVGYKSTEDTLYTETNTKQHSVVIIKRAS